MDTRWVKRAIGAILLGWVVLTIGDKVGLPVLVASWPLVRHLLGAVLGLVILLDYEGVIEGNPLQRLWGAGLLLVSLTSVAEQLRSGLLT